MRSKYEWYDEWDMDNGGFKVSLMDRTQTVTRNHNDTPARAYTMYSITYFFHGLDSGSFSFDGQYEAQGQ